MLFGQQLSLVCRNSQWKKRKCYPSEPAGFVAMRQAFHHPALKTCGASLPQGKKYVGVRFLTKELVFFVVDVKTKCQEVFEDACKYLGLQDTELFGLAFAQDEEYIFVDPNLKISKYAVKSWRTTDFGIDSNGQPLLTLFLRVKHYVECHLLISEKVARHHYYLQLRENVRNYSQALSEEKSFLLAALALQADLGNYSEQKHKGQYFDINYYFPSWIVLKTGADYIIQNVPALHKDNVGLSRGEAQVGYIREASDSTAPHNLQFYKIRRRKGKTWNVVWLGITDSGIGIYEQPESCKTKHLLSSFLWCDIAKLYFEKKKFEILSEGSPEYRRFTYYASSEDMAKHLLWLCRTTHHFHMSNEARVQELKKLKLDGGKTYREVYVYTDQQDLAWEERQNPSSSRSSCGNTVTKTGVAVQRRSTSRQVQNILRSQEESRRKLERKSVPCPVLMTKNHSMEVLPWSNGGVLSADTRYKSQSVACFPDRFLTHSTVFVPESTPSHLWSPASNSSLSTTPTSTLLSRSSCTDSACSSLSLTSGSTVKASRLSAISKIRMDDNSQWVKCDSFEELSVDSGPVESKSLPHKMCISTFKDNHVRTASLYDASSLCSTTKPQVSKSPNKVTLASHISPPKSGYGTTLQGQGHVNCKSVPMPFPEQNVLLANSVLPNKYAPRQNTGIQTAQNVPANRYSESATHLYNRTATRIGISSLKRDQRLPLTLFSNRGKITACGSEPNLYNSLTESNSQSDISLANEQCRSKVTAMKKPNSRSEICLNVIGQNISEYPVNCSEFQLTSHKSSTKSSNFNGQFPVENANTSTVDVVNTDFPFIPPPPAYRNKPEEIVEHPVSMYSSTSALNITSKEKTKHQQIPRSASDAHRELRGSLSSPPDVLDLQQLRQKSKALDLPLISALCNDRSLLMLPKTVPTCSRQRHVGNKDPLRFARGYSTDPGNGTLTDPLESFPPRPVSWHVSSVLPAYSDDPRGNPLWYKVEQDIVANSNGSEIVMSSKPNLPPTILTSFGRTPEKQCIPSSDYYNYKASDYRLNKIQMIPTKLLAGSMANGRIHQKGSSS